MEKITEALKQEFVSSSRYSRCNLIFLVILLLTRQPG
jgi:hypothetical protein